MVGHRGRGDGVGDAGHGHRGRSAGRGRDRRHAACGALVVDPDGTGALVIIVDIIGREGRRGGDFVVAVDGRRGERQDGGSICHEGTLDVVQQDRRDVHLAVVHGKAQGGGVDLTAAVHGGEGVVEEHGTLLEGQSLALTGIDLIAQAQCAGLTELSCGEGTAQLCHIIAQQAQRHGAGFFQRDGVVRAEAAVGVAGHPAVLDSGADVDRIGRVAVHIAVEAAGAALCRGGIAVSRECGEETGRLPTSEGRTQRTGLPGGQTAQCRRRLDCRVGADRRGGQHQHGNSHADSQQECEESFFHGKLLNHISTLRWGSGWRHGGPAGSRTGHRCRRRCPRRWLLRPPRG